MTSLTVFFSTRFLPWTRSSYWTARWPSGSVLLLNPHCSQGDCFLVSVCNKRVMFCSISSKAGWIDLYVLLKMGFGVFHRGKHPLPRLTDNYILTNFHTQHLQLVWVTCCIKRAAGECHLAANILWKEMCDRWFRVVCKLLEWSCIRTQNKFHCKQTIKSYHIVSPRVVSYCILTYCIVS